MASKYDRLRRYLNVRTQASVTLTFREIEKILGGPLPPSARTHAAWWANEDPQATRHTHSRAWTRSGRKARVNLTAETVDFSN